MNALCRSAWARSAYGVEDHEVQGMDVHKDTRQTARPGETTAVYSFTRGLQVFILDSAFQKLNVHPLSIWGMLYIQCKSFSVD